MNTAWMMGKSPERPMVTKVVMRSLLHWLLWNRGWTTMIVDTMPEMKVC